MWDPKRTQARKRLDQRLGQLKPMEKYARPAKGWIRAIRESLGMTASQLADRLNISQQSVSELEKSEMTGSIRLKSLQSVAEALDCRVVYALIPNSTLQETVEKRARAIAYRDISGVTHTMALEQQSVTSERTRDLIEDYIQMNLREKDLWREDS